MFAGLTNEYLINTDSPAALTYNDCSINENGHAALAFGILLKESNNFLEVWLSLGHLQEWDSTQCVPVSPSLLASCSTAEYCSGNACHVLCHGWARFTAITS